MVTIQICVGSACHLKGSYSIINEMQDLISENNLSEKVSVKAAFCLGNCQKPVSVKFEDEETVFSLDPKDVSSFFTTEVLKRV